METRQLIRRNLVHYWRTNLAVILGVAAAVSVLAGALLVGDSVRASLRDLFLVRLAGTEYAVVSNDFFRQQLADDLNRNRNLTDNLLSVRTALIEVEGTVSNETTKARAGSVRVYGVDEKFWNDPALTLTNREIFVSDGLAHELETKPGDSILVQIKKYSEVPIESLHGQKEDLGKTMRLTIKKTLSLQEGGEFSIQPTQTAVRAVFVPLKFLQTELEQEGRANVLLVTKSKDSEADQTAAVQAALKETAQLEDFGLKLRVLNQDRGLSLERSSTLLDGVLTEKAVAAANAHRLSTIPVLSYVANTISIGERAIPYSLVTAIDDETFAKLGPLTLRTEAPPIILNEWAARDLDAKTGQTVALEYYVWRDDGRLETKTADFYIAAVTPISGFAADRDLVPNYPGISDSPSLSDWDPPFPVDLKRIRPQDEEYWDQYKTTPKAFIPLQVGQNLWQSRYGKLTSIRVLSPSGIPPETASKFREQLRADLDPSALGLAALHVKQEGLIASKGATNFGEYFLYFSFFLVVSALLLASLFFKLGIEQRLREIGLLQAIGFPPAKIRRLFLVEGILLAVIGSVLGLAGAVVYAKLLMYGLSTWWVGAVGTTMLTLHVSPIWLLVGAVGGVVAAVLCIIWTLRRVGGSSTRSLVAGTAPDEEPKRKGRFARVRVVAGLVFGVAGVLLIVFAAARVLRQQVGFFAGGTLLLIAFLIWQSQMLRRNRRQAIAGHGLLGVLRLGFRNASYRPARSVLCIALIASAAFIIVSVDSFRRTSTETNSDRKSGSGGFPLMAESLVPIVHDLNSPEGRSKFNLNTLTDVNVTRLRLRPGDDASCLNLYQPRNPRILGVPESFINSNRFVFQSSSARAENPWQLLNQDLGEAVVPVVADANSATYVLHLKLGDEFALNTARGQVRLKLVGTLADSIFQSELIMAEKQFLRLFPDQEGHRYFLIDAPELQAQSVAVTFEDRLSDFGFDVVSTGERLASFHRVENTYLSTFQMLGGLGLLLGTLGMAAVLLRNVLERRRELALLRAIGYNSSHFTYMVIAENAFLLVSGIATGAFCALLAIAPVFIERGGRLPNISLGVLLLAVLIFGLTASLVATWSALRSPLLPALRAE